MQRTCLVLAAVMLITGIAYADPAHLEGRAASSTAEILPGKINPNSGHWTFVVREFPPDQICRFVLSVGDRTYQGHRSATTTASSSLWEVFYEPLDTTQVATAEAWSGEGECSQIHVQRQLTWRRHTRDQDSLRVPGMIGAWPRPGLLGYEPGPRERTLGELVGTDPELLQRLQEIGAERFAKASPLPDTTTWVIRHGRPFRIKASGIRYYGIWVGTDHNMPAVALILLEAPGIDKAVSHTRDVEDFDDPPVAPILEGSQRIIRKGSSGTSFTDAESSMRVRPWIFCSLHTPYSTGLRPAAQAFSTLTDPLAVYWHRRRPSDGNMGGKA